MSLVFRRENRRTFLSVVTKRQFVIQQFDGMFTGGHNISFCDPTIYYLVTSTALLNQELTFVIGGK